MSTHSTSRIEAHSISGRSPPHSEPAAEARPHHRRGSEGADHPAMIDLFAAHLNPGQLHFMKLLGFHKVMIERAEGMYYIDQNGRKILDFFGGFGSLAFGHNHPRILEARKKFQDEKRHEIAMAFMSQYAAALAHNLAAVSRPAISTWCSSARPAPRPWKRRSRLPSRRRARTLQIVYAENSFHGKTKGVLVDHRWPALPLEFKLSSNNVKCRSATSTRSSRAFEADPSIGMVVPRNRSRAAAASSARRRHSGSELRALCDKHGVLWIADEVQCGSAVPARFYAFEHCGVVPDVTALAKSLGGGKTRDGGDDCPPRGLHEGLRHAEDRADPWAGNLRRHRRSLHHRDRGAQHPLRRGPDRQCADTGRIPARTPGASCRRSIRRSSRMCAARA